MNVLKIDFVSALINLYVKKIRLIWQTFKIGILRGNIKKDRNLINIRIRKLFE